VLGVLLEDVLAGLRTNLPDKGLKQIDRYFRLAALERCLGRVELGEQAARDSLTVDMSMLRRVVDARTKRLNRRFMGTIVHCLRPCWYGSDQTKHEQGQCD
jgi:hypothetical protein